MVEAILAAPGRLLYWLATHPLLGIPPALCAVVGWLVGWLGLALFFLAALVTLTGWRMTHPASFRRVLIQSLRSWCAWRIRYAGAWPAVMAGCGLTATSGERVSVPPRVIRMSTSAAQDQLWVRLLPGQDVSCWERRAEAIGHAFGASGCRVVSTAPGTVLLTLTRSDTLASALDTTTLPLPATGQDVDLGGLPIGRCEDGSVWRLPLLGSHVLLGGATGSGKSSVLWSLLRALAPAIRDGLVCVWAVDPKGGMELAPGAGLFSRVADDDPADMALLLEDAVELMRERARRLKGHTRRHSPSMGEPLVLVVVDELAALIAYATDRDVRRRAGQALSMLLTQGRAVGVLVIAAVQDPRKEILPFRDLFPTRVALRLVEDLAVDMVLGRGARDRGAVCDQIPESTPGIGYAVLDGHAEPVRVRAAWVDDHAIEQLAQTHAPGRPSELALRAEEPVRRDGASWTH
jgi:S-DNA-T family DNA segregation ATPase FtsK/SpoIIIE